MPVMLYDNSCVKSHDVNISFNKNQREGAHIETQPQLPERSSNRNASAENESVQY